MVLDATNTIPIAQKIIDVGNFSAVDDMITLDETGRHRRRIKLVSDGGIEFLLNLPAARLLRHGDALALDDGRLILVQAEAEELLKVRGTDQTHLLQLAWQLGNRHLATQIEVDFLLIRNDDVIANMLIGLGAKIKKVTEPFSPQGGAYGHAPHEH